MAVPPRATLDAGHQVDADATIEVTPVKRGAKSATLRLRALAVDDADTSDDLAITAPVVVVGDSAIRRAGARSVSGSATGGAGAASKAGRRVKAVHVAIRRLGSRLPLAGGVRQGPLAQRLREDVRRASGLDPGARDGALVADAAGAPCPRGATSSSRGRRSRPGSPKRGSATATATSAGCACGERSARNGRDARRRRARGAGLWRVPERARARQCLSRRRGRRADALVAHVRQANRAYADFAAGRLEGEAAAKRMARTRDDVQALRGALAALRPPGEARALHMKMLRVFDLELALATETAQLAAYVPAESAVLARLPAANRRLRQRLAAASRDPAAQARALGAFQVALDRTVGDLRSLRPPPVLRVGHGDRIHALARTAALSGRLRNALRDGDAVRAARLLDQLERTPPDRRALARESVAAYNHRSGQVLRAVQDVRSAEVSLNRRFPPS